VTAAVEGETEPPVSQASLNPEQVRRRTRRPGSDRRGVTGRRVASPVVRRLGRNLRVPRRVGSRVYPSGSHSRPRE
jgi:hypothetical protein